MIKLASGVRIETYLISSVFLKRDVVIDFYITALNGVHPPRLLFINDGQDLLKMPFEKVISAFANAHPGIPLLCVAIHCGSDRRNEYGVVDHPDYMGRGSKAALYERFIFEELIPLVGKVSGEHEFSERAFCGFSLGGLSALNLVWRNPKVFQIAGVFSGSLWWRSVAQEAAHFDEERHRIIHNVIREGKFQPGLRFFFETGTLDETADRNNNGIIDSIDDTLALIGELERKGYSSNSIAYFELKDGRHDVATWKRAFPKFLDWAFVG